MTENQNCPNCDAPLPADAPEGSCPKCLLAAGFESADGGAAADGPEFTAVAEQFPELEILSELGRGGMGVVYKARQKNLDRLVALKVLPRALVEGDEGAVNFEERFTREARALARLSHPNIVGVHEFGEREGVYYFLMELVDGANLRQAMRAGDLTPVQALAIVPQICDALQYAHDQGVVHRDIKPENVLLDNEGTVKIADFGLAKLITKAPDERTLTRQGLVMGTPHYMAPEQIEKPAEVDHRADIYSLGVVLYEMLTGELPIGRFAPPSEKVHVDVRLDEVVLRALEKDVGRRYQAVTDVKTGIADLGDGVASADARRHVPPVESTRSRLALWAVLLPIIGVLVSVVASIGMTLLQPSGGTFRGAGMPIVLSLSTITGVAVLVGSVLAIVALVQIQRSKGRLHGTGFAIAGLILPFLCCAPAGGLSFLMMRTAPSPESDVGAPEPIEETRMVLPMPEGDLIYLADRTVQISAGGPGLRVDLIGRRGDESDESMDVVHLLREGHVFVIESVVARAMTDWDGGGVATLHVGEDVVRFEMKSVPTHLLWTGRYDVAVGAEADVWLESGDLDAVTVDVIGRVYRIQEDE